MGDNIRPLPALTDELFVSLKNVLQIFYDIWAIISGHYLPRLTIFFISLKNVLQFFMIYGRLSFCHQIRLINI